MRTDNLRIAIVGAGLGGLCLAQGLRRHGIHADVYERDPAVDSRTQGYRIRIDHDGQQALAACLPPASWERFLRSCARPVAQVNLWNTELDDCAERWVSAWRRPSSREEHPDRSADRQTLRSVLMHGIEARVHFGKGLAHYDEAPAGVSLHFADGSQVEADLLVGADGIHSAVRRQRAPAHAPSDSGAVCIYGKTPPRALQASPASEAWLDATSIVFAEGSSVIVDAMRFWRDAFEFSDTGARMAHVEDYVYWAILGKRAAFGLPGHALPSLTPAQLDPLIERVTQPWASPLRALFDRRDRASTALAPVYRVTTLPEWPSSRVTLLGDAIHPMSPAGGLGANTALRDARVLAESLADASAATLIRRVHDYEAGMRAYAQHALAASDQSAASLLEPLAAM